MTLLDNITSIRRGAMTAIGGLMVTLCAGGVGLVWREARGIAESIDELSAQIASTEVAIRANADGVEANAAAIGRLLGEDRVILVKEGSAYVEEPVYAGEPITLHLTLRRTRLGATCLIREGRVLFEDARRVPMPGTTTGRPRNFGTTWEPIEIRINPPEGLLNGRNLVDVQVTYDCNGEVVIQLLGAVPYIQLPERIEP